MREDHEELAVLTERPSKAALWTGRALSALVVLFLVFDGVIKVMGLDIVRETMAQLGYPATVAFGSAS